MTCRMYPEALDGVQVKSQAEVDLFEGFVMQLSDPLPRVPQRGLARDPTWR